MIDRIDQTQGLLPVRNMLQQALQLCIDGVIWNVRCNHPHFGDLLSGSVWLVFGSRAIPMQRKDHLQIISSRLTVKDLVETSNIHQPSESRPGVKRPEPAGRPGGRSADQGKQ